MANGAARGSAHSAVAGHVTRHPADDGTLEAARRLRLVGCEA